MQLRDRNLLPRLGLLRLQSCWQYQSRKRRAGCKNSENSVPHPCDFFLSQGWETTDTNLPDAPPTIFEVWKNTILTK